MTVVIEYPKAGKPHDGFLVPLGEVAEFINGAAFKPTDWEDEGRRIIRIQNLNDPTKPFNRTTKDVPEKLKVYPGDLLVSWSASLGVFTWKNDDVAVLNQHIFRVVPDESSVTKAYLRHMLSGALVDMEEHLHGATMKHVNRGEFLSTQIPLPPLEEQHRIAAILDKADQLRTKRRQALAHLDALTPSLFRSIFGHSNENTEKWPTVALESVASQITDGEHQTPKRQASGIKLLSARNVRNGRLDVGNVDYIDMSEYERISRRCRPQRDDVLISCSGSIGRVAVVDTDENFSLVRSVALVRPRPEMLLSKFLEQQLLTPKLQRKMNQSANTSSQANLFQGPIRKLPIVLPPIELQRDFVDKTVAVERLKDHHRSQIVALDDLFASLQHRAFRGEL